MKYSPLREKQKEPIAQLNNLLQSKPSLPPMELPPRCPAHAQQRRPVLTSRMKRNSLVLPPLLHMSLRLIHVAMSSCNFCFCILHLCVAFCWLKHQNLTLPSTLDGVRVISSFELICMMYMVLL